MRVDRCRVAGLNLLTDRAEIFSGNLLRYIKINSARQIFQHRVAFTFHHVVVVVVVEESALAMSFNMEKS